MNPKEELQGVVEEMQFHNLLSNLIAQKSFSQAFQFDSHEGPLLYDFIHGNDGIVVQCPEI